MLMDSLIYKYNVLVQYKGGYKEPLLRQGQSFEGILAMEEDMTRVKLTLPILDNPVVKNYADIHHLEKEWTILERRAYKK
jgi:hypothetical protein